jgi:hypothetical protein
MSVVANLGRHVGGRLSPDARRFDACRRRRANACRRRLAERW